MKALSRIALVARTLPNLGWRSVLLVMRHRIRLALDANRATTGRTPAGPFFRGSDGAEPPSRTCFADAMDIFGRPIEFDEQVDFHLDSFSGSRFDFTHREWAAALKAFPRHLDIKGIWELSRFYWAPRLAFHAKQGELAALDELNALLTHWLGTNPPGKGLNWGCGQESAIKLLHLAAAAVVLDQDHNPEDGLLDFIHLLSERVSKTISYGLSQQNNHALTEAAAMFVGASWLGQDTAPSRRIIERTVADLLAEDGSWAQYSVGYHRVVVDTLSFMELWRRRRALVPFSDRFTTRARAATHWLRQVTDPVSGHAPNIGANDSTRLFSMATEEPDDLRGTVALASAIFNERLPQLSNGPWQDRLAALNLPVAGNLEPAPVSETFAAGGLHILRTSHVVAYMKFPRALYRPPQADALHVDLWVASDNVLRDAGSYRYTSAEDDNAWYAGTSAHNTVTFDEVDQMPRIGRFLFGDWIEAGGVEEVQHRCGTVTAAAGYRNRAGHCHHRRIALSSDALQCQDTVSGFTRSAVLRWRLKPSDWCLREDGTVTDGKVCITVTAEGQSLMPRLTETRESQVYHRQTTIPMVEIDVSACRNVTTTVAF